MAPCWSWLLPGREAGVTHRVNPAGHAPVAAAKHGQSFLWKYPWRSCFHMGLYCCCWYWVWKKRRWGHSRDCSTPHFFCAGLYTPTWLVYYLAINIARGLAVLNGIDLDSWRRWGWAWGTSEEAEAMETSDHGRVRLSCWEWDWEISWGFKTLWTCKMEYGIFCSLLALEASPNSVHQNAGNC